MECTSVWDCQTCSLLAVEECYSLQTQSLSKALTPLPLIPPAYMIKPFIRSAKSLFGPGRSACLNTEWVLMMVKRTPNKRAPPAASLRNGEVSFPRANLANQIMRSSHGRANSSLTFDNGNWRKTYNTPLIILSFISYPHEWMIMYSACIYNKTLYLACYQKCDRDQRFRGIMGWNGMCYQNQMIQKIWFHWSRNSPCGPVYLSTGSSTPKTVRHRKFAFCYSAQEAVCSFLLNLAVTTALCSIINGYGDEEQCFHSHQHLWTKVTL